MGGYINQNKQQFIHKDAKCPSNCSAYQDGAICVGYDTITKTIHSCSGHRNANSNRNMSFDTYYEGDIIDSKSADALVLTNGLDKEITARR